MTACDWVAGCVINVRSSLCAQCSNQHVLRRVACVSLPGHRRSLTFRHDTRAREYGDAGWLSRRFRQENFGVRRFVLDRSDSFHAPNALASDCESDRHASWHVRCHRFPRWSFARAACSDSPQSIESPAIGWFRRSNLTANFHRLERSPRCVLVPCPSRFW